MIMYIYTYFYKIYYLMHDIFFVMTNQQFFLSWRMTLCKVFFLSLTHENFSVNFSFFFDAWHFVSSFRPNCYVCNVLLKMCEMFLVFINVLLLMVYL